MSLCRQIEADLYCQDIPEDGRFILNRTANLNYQLPSLEIQWTTYPHSHQRSTKYRLLSNLMTELPILVNPLLCLSRISGNSKFCNGPVNLEVTRLKHVSCK